MPGRHIILSSTCRHLLAVLTANVAAVFIFLVPGRADAAPLSSSFGVKRGKYPLPACGERARVRSKGRVRGGTS